MGWGGSLAFGFYNLFFKKNASCIDNRYFGVYSYFFLNHVPACGLVLQVTSSVQWLLRELVFFEN